MNYEEAVDYVLQTPKFTKKNTPEDTRRFFAFLGMDCFQHEGYRFHLITRCNGKDVSVEMYGIALVSGIWEDFRNGFQHPQIFITDNQAYTGKPAFLQPYKERTPALTILFHTFSSAKNFTASILADADCN